MARRAYIDLSAFWRRPSLWKYAQSDRSDGKTTQCKILALQGYNDDPAHRARVFMRRWGTEFDDEFFRTFWDNLHDAGRDNLIPVSCKFVAASKKRCAALVDTSAADDGEYAPILQFVPLTRAGRLKSVFSYARTHDIFFDEYVPLDNRYIGEEGKTMAELYTTIDRKHYDNKIIFCANRVTACNPIFDFFAVDHVPQKGIETRQNGKFDILTWYNAGNRQLDVDSAGGDLFAGTPYDAYNRSGGVLAPLAVQLVKPELARRGVPLCGVIWRKKKYSVNAVAGGGGGNVAYVVTANVQKMPALTVSDVPTVGAYVFTMSAARDVRMRLADAKIQGLLYYDSDATAFALRDFDKAIR